MKQSYRTDQGPFQYPTRRLIVRSCEVSKPRDLYLKRRCACQISKRCDHFNYQSRGFETTWDVTMRRVIGYWNGAQVVRPLSPNITQNKTQQQVSNILLLCGLFYPYPSAWWLLHAWRSHDMQPHYWPFVRESTALRCIPLPKGQYCACC